MENADMENIDIKNTDMENADMENADMTNYGDCLTFEGNLCIFLIGRTIIYVIEQRKCSRKRSLNDVTICWAAYGRTHYTV